MLGVPVCIDEKTKLILPKLQYFSLGQRALWISTLYLPTKSRACSMSRKASEAIIPVVRIMVAKSKFLYPKGSASPETSKTPHLS